jgi:uncharacterized protein YegL
VAVAALLPLLMAMVGLAVDLGQVYVAHTRLQNAVDAGAMAASAELPYDPDLSTDLVPQAAQDMLVRNYPEARVAGIAEGSEIRSVCVTAEADVPLLLLDVIGVADPTVTADACAGFNNLEVAMAIDNSGSMSGSPIENVKAASRDLAELIMPDGTQAATRMGLVPFRGKVHLPAGVDGLGEGCRNADGSVNDGIHEDFMDLYYDLPWQYRQYYIDEDTCTDIPMVQGLTDDKATILSAIDTQDAEGDWSGTVISEGVRWATHVLTPEAPYTEGGDPDDWRKVLILLTDGDTEDGECGGQYDVGYDPNNYWTNAYYGMGDDTSHCEDGGALNQAMLDTAQAAKDAGIEIFAIRFGNSDAVDVALMKQVASSRPGTDDHYFDAPTAEDIPEVFRRIGKQLGWRLLN